MTGVMTSFTAELRSVTWPRDARPYPIVDAYAAVSVGNKNFSGPRLLAFLEWIERNVVRCRLVVGGELSRWTVMMERGVGEAEARAVARRHEKRQLAELRKALRRVQRPGAFSLSTCSELRLHERFASASREIAMVRLNDPQFAELVNFSARQFCEARMQRGRLQAVSMAEAHDLSVAFISEELALFCVLVATGSLAEVYPGPDLPVLAAIAAGHFPLVPRELRERVNVEVEIHPAHPRPTP
jgi:tRNA-dependent cyclodipeptide synthase